LNIKKVHYNLENKLQLESRPQEKCGIFAVYNYHNPRNTANVTYLGLLALQHRGQESAGMAFSTPTGLQCVKGMGMVARVFTREILESIQAASMLGHIRYATTGSSSSANAQPLLARSFDKKGIALAHNGNLTNTRRLRNQQLREGQIFHTTSDTEIILSYLFRYRKEGLASAIKKTMSHISGAYAVVAINEQEMVAFRDPGGYRPLVMGKLGDAVIFSSETAALDTVGADFVREIEPGEIVSVSSGGIKSTYAGENMAGRSLCIFEYVYFARPDSIIDGHNVHSVRKAVGSLLADRIPVKPDIVIPSPDSGVSAAMGLAEALKLPLEWAIHRNSYLGRTFITPNQKDREQAVRLKFNPIGSLVEGKKIAIVDDSLVRGTTARVLTSLLKNAGAAEVHLCIASPPYKNPCYYGIDIPVAEDLAFSDSDYSKLAKEIGADSLTFAEPDDLYQVLGKKQSDYCSSCFSNSR